MNGTRSLCRTPLVASVPQSESRSRVPSASGASSRGPQSSVGTPHCRAIIAGGALGPEIAVGDEQRVDLLPAEMLDHGLDMLLVAHQAVRQDGVEVAEGKPQTAQDVDDLPLLHERVFVRKHELADGAEPQLEAPFRPFPARRFAHRSSFSVSPMASSMMSSPLSSASSSITTGGLIRRIWPAGIQASPLRKAFW